MTDYTGLGVDAMYDPSADNTAIQRALQQAALLRKQAVAPQGQMVSGIYVKPSIGQQLIPLINNAVADLKESQADEKQKEVARMSQAALQAWMASRPTNQTTYGAGEEGPTMTVTPPTDAQTTQWATKGLNNPLAKTLATKVLEDTVVNAPIRAEKAADKIDLKERENRRFEEDRQARLATTMLTLQQRAAEMESRERTALALGQNTAEIQAQRMQLQQQIAELNGQYKLQNTELQNKGKLEAVNAKAASSAGGKPLGSTQQKALTDASSDVFQQKTLLESFKPEYAGLKGKWDQATGSSFFRNDPNAQAASQWWKTFSSFNNIDRHKLFGSALTAQEKGEWEKTTVNPMSSAESIKKAVETRARLAQVALDRYGEVLQAQTPAEAVAVAKKYAQGGQGNALGSPSSTNALPLTLNSRGNPTQKGDDNSVREILLQEWKKPQSSAADRDGLRRELARVGVNNPPPPPADQGAPAQPAKVINFSDLK